MTYAAAGTALDTFLISNLFYIHKTVADALLAVGTFAFVHLDPENRNPGKQGINSAQGT